jgi:hypothetical protein
VVCPKTLVQLGETDIVPLLLHSPQLGRSRNPIDLEVYMGRDRPADIVQDIREIVSRWPVDIIERAAHIDVPSSPNHMLESRLAWRSALTIGITAMQVEISAHTGGNPRLQQMLSSIDFDRFPEPQLLYEAIYELVTQALGLDYGACRAREDIRIVLCLSQHPSIGLWREASLVRQILMILLRFAETCTPRLQPVHFWKPGRWTRVCAWLEGSGCPRILRPSRR